MLTQNFRPAANAAVNRAMTDLHWKDPARFHDDRKITNTNNCQVCVLAAAAKANARAIVEQAREEQKDI